jgi:hypothetical protein
MRRERPARCGSAETGCTLGHRGVYSLSGAPGQSKAIKSRAGMTPCGSIRDCRFPSSAAAMITDEQRKGSAAARKTRRVTGGLSCLRAQGRTRTNERYLCVPKTLNPGVLMVKSAKEGMCSYEPGSLSRPRSRAAKPARTRNMVTAAGDRIEGPLHFGRRIRATAAACRSVARHAAT